MTLYSYCPVCGGPIGSRARDVLVCGTCRFQFFQNSKPCAGALIARSFDGEKRVLLARRAIEPYKGQWDIPGGFLGNGEHPEAGLQRELREELGVSAGGFRLFCVELDEYPREDVAEEARFTLCLYYTCLIPRDAVLHPADDVSEARWFPLSRPPVDLAFPANRRVLERARTAGLTEEE